MSVLNLIPVQVMLIVPIHTDHLLVNVTQDTMVMESHVRVRDEL